MLSPWAYKSVQVQLAMQKFPSTVQGTDKSKQYNSSMLLIKKGDTHTADDRLKAFLFWWYYFTVYRKLSEAGFLYPAFLLLGINHPDRKFYA
jgi:hypothetical protein